MLKLYIYGKQWLYKLTRLEEGQGLIEYGLIVVLIAIVVIAILNAIGVTLQGSYNEISTQLDSAGYP